MAEVPDHLVPTQGLTNSHIEFAGFDVLEGGAVLVRFAMCDEDRNYLATFNVPVSPLAEGGTIDALVAEAHRRMCDVLRQWLYMTDVMRQAYEKRRV